MRVTIGIPFYNNERTLADAVRSVYAQTYTDWELILVDDGSTDRSLEMAQAITDPRVRVYHDGANKGLAARLNQITRLAQGEYLARMDGDDLMHPERLARQMAYLEAHPELDLIDTGAYSVDMANTPKGVRCLTPLDTRPQTMLRHGIIIHSAVTGKATWFRQNLYDESFARAQDHELWCRTYRTSTFGRLTEPLFFVREEGSVTLKKYLRSARMDHLILKRYGPAMVGWPQTLVMMSKAFLKGEIYRVFTLLGAQHLLIRKRNVQISDEEYAVARTAIETILQTHVPGLPARAPALAGVS